MFTEFVDWWLRQIRSLLSLWPRLAKLQPDAVIVAVESLRLEPELVATGAVLLRRHGEERVTAPLNLAMSSGPGPSLSVATGLRLPSGMVLHRKVSLPLAAARDLKSVIGFEMDRLTPFAAGDVFWSATAIARQPASGLLILTLIVTLRQPVEQLLAALGRLNLRPSFVECAAGRIELGRPRDRTEMVRRLTGISLCVALVVACLVTPVIRQQLALHAAAAQIARLGPSFQAAMLIRQRLATVTAGNAAIAAARQSDDALQALAALTNALPDGTFLADLTLKSGDLTIDGQSSNAAGLIAILAAAPGFHDPSFTAPVTRAIDGSADQFSIHATVTP